MKYRAADVSQKLLLANVIFDFVLCFSIGKPSKKRALQ